MVVAKFQELDEFFAISKTTNEYQLKESMQLNKQQKLL